MHKPIAVVAAAVLVAAVPAWAAKPPHPNHPTGGGGKTCTAQNEGYNAKGTVTSGTLTPGTRAGRFNGSLTVDVTRANHKAPTGSQTFTLTDARVHFGKGVSASALASGDRVALHGTITELPHRCSTTGFTPAITITHGTIHGPRKH